MPQATRGQLFGEIGRSGLMLAAGQVQDEFLRQLQGDRAKYVYREMSQNDPVVAAILFAIDMLVRKVEWRVDPASDSPDDKANAQFVDECMQDMSITWPDLISEIMTMLPFGWSYHELVYKLRRGPRPGNNNDSRFDDGRIGWRKMPIRSQESLLKWEWDDKGGIQGMWQIAAPEYVPTMIPIEKALLFRTKPQKGNPEGVSILRGAYRPWYFKKKIEEIEGIGIERDLAGLPVIYAPAELFGTNLDADKQTLANTLKQIVTNIRRDEQEGVLMPNVFDRDGHQMFKLELLSSGGSRQFDTDSVVQRYDQRIAMVVIADFILLGHDRVGSRSLGVSKQEMFATALGAWLHAIAEIFNRYAIPRLFQLNQIDTKELPKIQPSDVGEPDLEEISALITALAAAGMPLFPDFELENFLRKTAGWPTKEEQDQQGPEPQPKPVAQPELEQAARDQESQLAQGKQGGQAATDDVTKSVRMTRGHSRGNPFHDPADGKFTSGPGGAVRGVRDNFIPVGVRTPKGPRYGPTQIDKARRRALEKERKARSLFTADAGSSARYATARQMALSGKRPAGEFRGNSTDRRRSREKLAREFGDGTFAPCVHCGVKLHVDDITRDKIFGLKSDGAYRHENLVPSCYTCNVMRQDKPLRSFWKYLEQHPHPLNPRRTNAR